MKAMIFAAGLGTRMKQLTQNQPKALVEVAGEPVIDRVLERVIAAGFTELIINVHHFAGQLTEHIKKLHLPATVTFSHETQEPLETGGGLWKVRDFFSGNEPFLLHNADILTNLNLEALLHHHNKHQHLATLAVRERKSSRKLLFTNQELLCGRWKEKTNTTDVRWGEPALRYAFSGVHILSPEIFALPVPGERFSIMEAYLDSCKEHPIGMFTHNQGYWFDIGSPEKWQQANTYLTTKK